MLCFPTVIFMSYASSVQVRPFLDSRDLETISIIVFQARANALENTVPSNGSTQEETMGPESFDQDEMERHRNRIGRVKYKPAIRSFRVIKVRKYLGISRYILGIRLEETTKLV